MMSLCGKSQNGANVIVPRAFDTKTTSNDPDGTIILNHV